MGDDEAPEPKPKKRDKAALPFSEDTDKLDGRAWSQKPLIVIAVVLVVVAVVVAIVLAGKDLASDSDDGGTVDVPPPVSSTTTAAPTTTTTSTTTPPPTTAGPTGPQPGEPCRPEEVPVDCIDPENDTNFVIIIGGTACLETADDPLACADNDHDGDAGPAVIPS
jgi:hypothetical protein